ncbi:MAG: alpha/beta-hydrolase family protein [Pseudoxanthomonas sp.]
MAVLRDRMLAEIRRWPASLCGTGLLLGALCFAASLTPSLVPRTWLTQGVLAGLCFAAGYGVGLLLRRLWRYLELPQAPARLQRGVTVMILVACVGVVLSFLWRAAYWQNSIRAVMQMPPVDSAHPFKVGLLAIGVFAVAVVLFRIAAAGYRWLAVRLRKVLPRRVANVASALALVAVVWLLASDVLVRSVLRSMDNSFRELDALMEPERPQPTVADRCGSAASLVSWEGLGRAGREFIASGPDAEQIGRISGRTAREPLRIYVGLANAGDPQARARLALAEMRRVGAFDRKVLVVVTATGTGWVDPAAMEAVEYLHEGDVASVAMQYSYVSSPLSLLLYPDYGEAAAQALFREVYAYWTHLPKQHRPKLYLHGLSLGARNSERSAALFELLEDPIDGALWSGPPFNATNWRAITGARNPGTPQWLPQFRDGRMVRFINQHGGPVADDAPWGPLRIVYLQYASDPVAFFDTQALYRQPDWLSGPRGADVSPEFRWYPGVTALQLTLDMAMSTEPPLGYGHSYAPQHYLDAWAAVSGRSHWSAEGYARLRQHLEAEARRLEQGDADPAYGDRGG